jgi:hypothetical protein
MFFLGGRGMQGGLGVRKGILGHKSVEKYKKNRGTLISVFWG